jgi:hypothetical protein
MMGRELWIGDERFTRAGRAMRTSARSRRTVTEGATVSNLACKRIKVSAIGFQLGSLGLGQGSHLWTAERAT